MKTTDGLMVVFGGALFGVLFHNGFPEASTLWEAVAVGMVVMAPPVAARRLFGEQSTPRFLFVALLAGSLIGMGIWWLTGRPVSWFVFAGPAGVLAVAAATFERFAEQRIAGKDRSSPRDR